jgi:hypothetical protein
MKPLNYDNSPCSPTSSNCVIWQGPDLHIIKLCKGDTISDVIASLATELAIVMDQLSITNYDLSCFNLVGCKPETYQELLQFLIDQICLQNGTTVTTDAKSIDLNTLMTVAPCFVVNGITVMTLIDYVTAIGNKLCDIVDQIAVINNTLNEYNIRITTLENAVIPTYTLPSITVDCTLQNSPLVGSGTPALPIDQILSILINDDTYGYCALRTALGLPANLNAAVLSQCILNSDIQLSTGTAWSTNPNWDQTPTTVADAINNIWLVICDYYDFLSNIDNVVVAAGEGIAVTSATVGNVTTYTVTNNYLETFVANLTIEDVYAPRSGVIPLVSPASVDGVTDGQTISEYTLVSSNSQAVKAANLSWVPNGSLPTFTFGSFDNATGIFTVTDPGTYLIKATIHLKPNNSSSVFWSGPAATFSNPPTATELQNAFSNIGSFYIGITPDNTSDVYIADSQTLTPGLDRCVEISTSKVITTASTLKFKVKVLNTTNRSYNGTGYIYSDGISFSIIKLRTNLTITQL